MGELNEKSIPDREWFRNALIEHGIDENLVGIPRMDTVSETLIGFQVDVFIWGKEYEYGYKNQESYTPLGQWHRVLVGFDGELVSKRELTADDFDYFRQG